LTLSESLDLDYEPYSDYVSDITQECFTELHRKKLESGFNEIRETKLMQLIRSKNWRDVACQELLRLFPSVMRNSVGSAAGDVLSEYSLFLSGVTPPTVPTRGITSVHYWKCIQSAHGSQLGLAQFALRLLAALSSEAPCERMISRMKRAIGKLRYQMEPECLFSTLQVALAAKVPMSSS
jgi:hypothetical protein